MRGTRKPGALAAAAALGAGGATRAAIDDSAEDRAGTMAEALSVQIGGEVGAEDVLAAHRQVATDRAQQSSDDGEIAQE